MRRALDALKSLLRLRPGPSGRGRPAAAPRVVIRAPEPAAAELPPPSAVKPDLTPAPPDDFTGRSAELAELIAKAESGASVISLQGMPGIGKTALALKLAEALAPRFPDAQLWIDLHGSGPAAASTRSTRSRESSTSCAAASMASATSRPSSIATTTRCCPRARATSW